MNFQPPSDRAYRAALLTTWLIQMAATTASALFMVLPRVMSESGVPIFWHGWVMASYTVANTAAMVASSRVIERLGRGPTFAIGCVVAAIGGCGHTLGADSLLMLFAARTVFGAGLALAQMSGIDYVMAVAAPERRGSTVGFINTPYFLSTAFSPLIAEWLDKLHMNSTVFVLSGALSLLPLILVAKISRVATLKAAPAEPARHSPRFSVADYCLVTFFALFSFNTTFFSVLLPTLTAHRNDWSLSTFFMSYGLSAFITRTLLEAPLYRRYSPLRVGSTGVLVALGTVGFFWAAGWKVFLLLGVLCGAGHGVFYPGLLQLLTRSVPTDEVTSKIAKITGVSATGGILGQLCAGAVATALGVSHALLVEGIVIFALQVALISTASRLLDSKTP